MSSGNVFRAALTEPSELSLPVPGPELGEEEGVSGDITPTAGHLLPSGC